MATAKTIIITPLPSTQPKSTSPPAHHVGNPPTSFKNPWPSFHGKHSLLSVLQTRFSSDRNFVPVPATRDELVPIRKPDWGTDKAGSCLKATWIGHASFLVETARAPGASRGVRIFFDPVFSERMSPVGFVGPKRFSPTPCSLDEVPDVDLVVISHNHYDHLDLATIKEVYMKREGHVHFFCALGVKAWFIGSGIADEDVTQLDWWDGVKVDVDGIGSIDLTCTPAQHISGRSPWDTNAALWCSWVLEASPHKLYFAGDTGYRTITTSDSPNDEQNLPHCPAFAEIGKTYGPFDLALLPIGCYSPRTFMSGVHCAPEDSVCIHRDIRSKKSIGMHYGTVRGGLSAQFEDVREPPRRWKECCEREGLVWGEEVGICNLGETVVISE